MNYQMLLWLGRATGVSSRRLQAARDAVRRERSSAQEVAAVRRLIPWELIERKLWPAQGVLLSRTSVRLVKRQ